MSRIEDDNEAARNAERLALQKREVERQKKERRTGDIAFAQRMMAAQQQKQLAQEIALGKSVLTHAIREKPPQPSRDVTDAKNQQHHSDREQRQTEAVRTEKNRLQSANESKGLEANLLAEEFLASQGKGDAEQAALVSEGRRQDATSSRQSLASKKTSDDQATSSAFTQAPEADNSQGSGQNQEQSRQGQPQDNSKAAEQAGLLRMNPALLAPPPLVQPRQVPTSDRLRALAAEIAQKIVERVRVGENKAGKAEFQIDLRSHVLSGLSIRISGTKGRIRAVFSSHEREVLKLLREHGESLKKALASRGLTLEDLKFEERS